MEKNDKARLTESNDWVIWRECQKRGCVKKGKIVGIRKKGKTKQYRWLNEVEADLQKLEVC